MIVLELPLGLSSQFCIRSASRFGSDVARDRFSTHKCTVLFAKLPKGHYGRSVLEQLQ